MKTRSNAPDAAMTIQVTGKNIDVGEALRTYAEDKVQATLEKFVGDGFSGHVLFEKGHGNFRTDCSILLRSGMNLQSHAEAPDAYASADLAFERLEKRLRRYRRRLKDHHNNARHGAAHLSAPDYVIQVSEEDETEEAGADNPVIIAETTTVIRELSVSDAVMQMDLSNAPFVMFRNAGNGRVNIVYRRPDGNIGWIDPGGESAS